MDLGEGLQNLLYEFKSHYVLFMETAKQSYWHTEYQWFKNYVIDTKAKQEFKRFCKRQYHKTRRQYDKDIINNRLNKIAHEEYLLDELFNGGGNIHKYAQVV